MSKQNLYNYIPEQIRTSNMQSYRGSDLIFDPEVEPSLTQQSFKEECDINTLVKRYENTGLLTHVNRQTPVWGDFGESTDFQASLEYIREAEKAFMDLPASVRARFENNPANLLDFVGDAKNKDEAISLGLIDKPVENPSAVVPAPSE